MASEDENKATRKPFPWWAILITVIGVAAIVIGIYMYKRRGASMNTNAGVAVGVGAVPGPNVAPPPNGIGPRINSTAPPSAAGRI